MVDKGIRKGSIVVYHPIIGGPSDGKLRAVHEVGQLGEETVAWIAGKSGCVSQAALTLVIESPESDMECV